MKPGLRSPSIGRWPQPGEETASGPATRGFTLIEILIVISVLALVLATGIPAIFKAIKRDPLSQAVNDVVEACATARERAVLSGESTDMVIVAQGGAIRVERAPSDKDFSGRSAQSSNPKIPEPGAAATGGMRPMHLHEDVAVELLYVNLTDQMKEPQARVCFHPNGTSDEFALVMRYKEKVTKIEMDIVTGLPDILVLR